jgi:archaeal chaperonin
MGSEDKSIYSENTSRNSNKNAQRMNIYAAKLVAETVKSTLGPKGMDKMLVDSNGDIIVTNDGVTILKQIDVDHPAAKMIIEIAKTQEAEVGDGTTSAVILSGELLRKAEELLDQGIHPTSIIKGYKFASKNALEILPSLAEKIDRRDDTLKKIAMTAMTGKGPEEDKEHLANIILQAVNKVSKNTQFEKEDISIEIKTGAPVNQTKLIKGVVVDKEKVHSAMPKKIENAKIALINAPIEIKSLDSDAKISIHDPEKLQSFMDFEERMLKKITDKIISTGTNVVFCQKGIDDLAQHFFAKKGIYAVRRVKKTDIEKLSKATNAKIVSDIQDITTDDLGRAGLVHEVLVGEEKMTYVEDCENPKNITLLVRANTTHIVEETKRAIEDAIGDIHSTKDLVVFGAGNFEMRLSKELTKKCLELSGREQLAALAFAKSLEIIPKTLAENAGLDAIDILTKLQSELETNKFAGINVFDGTIIDANKEGIVEPLKIKVQAISSASDVATTILRIDDVILSKLDTKQE